MTELSRWFGENAPCWVCAVVDGTARAYAVLETPEILVLAAPLSLSPGHTLVVPRQHVRDLYTLPEELAGAVLSAASRVARAAKRAFAADGITLRQHNEAAGGQEVFHFHLHVVPRFRGDVERFNSPPKLIRFEEQQEIAERLHTALASV
jgi:histidine triad (HIT) family protein